jgi:hypothetical protein
MRTRTGLELSHRHEADGIENCPGEGRTVRREGGAQHDKHGDSNGRGPVLLL